MTDSATPSNLHYNPQGLNWIGYRFADPIGKVFLQDQRFIRAIYTDKADQVQQLLESDMLRQLEQEQLLPRTRICPETVRGFAFCVETQSPDFNTRLADQPFPLIREAARKWVRINQILLQHDHLLIDGHVDNFALFGAVPKWVDLGSIQALGSLAGIRQFKHNILIPLLLAASSPRLCRIARNLIRDGGCTEDEAAAMACSLPRMQAPLLQDSFGLLAEVIDKLDFSYPSTTWSDYTPWQEMEQILAYSRSAAQEDRRSEYFLREMDRLAPTKVMDLGSCSGRFSILTARLGIPCLAVDSDEASLARLADFAAAKQLPITTIQHNVLQLQPQKGVDCILAMALVHHLAISQFSSFELIARLFAGLTEHGLITEYMPNGLGAHQPSPDPLPESYRLEAFLEALARHFRHLEVIDYDRGEAAPRTMISCWDKVFS